MNSHKTICCSLDADLHRALMSAAEDQYTNATTIVRQALAAFLRDNNYLEPRTWGGPSKAGWRDGQ